MMSLLQFEKDYRIHVYETGPDGRFSHFSMSNFIQSIAAIKMFIIFRT
jgi:hypothetical protein